MSTYTVQDSETGKKITFDWSGSEPPTDGDMQEIFSQAKQPSTPQPQPTPQKELPIPDWAAKNPNLYGVAATAANIGSPIVESLAGLGGAVAGGLGGIPTGPGAIATGALTGAAAYAGTKNLTSALKQYLGIEKGPETPIEAVKQSGENLLGGAAMQVAPAAIQPVVSGVAKGVGNLSKAFMGMATGSGRGMTETAVKSGEAAGFTPLEKMVQGKMNEPDTFIKSMRGRITGDEIIDDSLSAFRQISNKRANDYQGLLEKVSQNTKSIDDTPVKAQLDKLMSNYNIRLTKELPAEYAGWSKEAQAQIKDALPIKPVVNFDKSVFGTNKEAQQEIKGIIDYMEKWSADPTNKTPMGFDLLKRNLDNFYSKNSAARQFVASLRGKVNDTVSQSVPEYAQMTKGYQEATNLMNTLEKTLMVGSKADKHTGDQILRRLSSSMRENFELRKEMLEVLGDRGGKDLVDQVAGYNAKEALPKGLVGKLYGGGVMTSLLYTMNPKILPLLAISSPRLVGEFLHTYGKALVEAKRMSPATYNTMAYQIGKAVSEQNKEKDNGH